VSQEPKGPRAQKPKIFARLSLNVTFCFPITESPCVPRAQMSPESQEPQEPKCPRAQVPRCPRAQEPKCPRAQVPKCPRAQKPKIFAQLSLNVTFCFPITESPSVPRAQMSPESQEPQEPKCPRAQVPKCPRAQKPKIFARLSLNVTFCFPITESCLLVENVSN
jgi:hypothetical protein